MNTSKNMVEVNEVYHVKTDDVDSLIRVDKVLGSRVYFTELQVNGFRVSDRIDYYMVNDIEKSDSITQR